MSGTPPPGGASAAAPAADWRKSVLQSYRNSEVREISKVLAALEGSATVTPASKLMLAMRFEDQIFKSAKDLADYRKKISKRLKKLQKNYVRPAATPPPSKASGSKAAPAGGQEDNTEAKKELTAKLKRDYGEELKYIVKNAAAAVADLKRKLGPEKARQLQQHTDSCRHWARDLRLLTEEELEVLTPSVESASSSSEKADEAKKESDSKPNQQQQSPSSSEEPSQTPKNETEPPKKISNKAVPLSLSHLQRMEKHMQTRVSNIRSYVVKHADPDQFVLETLQSRDVAFSKNVLAGNLFRDILQGRINRDREIVRKATATTAPTNTQINNQNDPSKGKTGADSDDPLLVLQKALEKALAGVPPPTRNDSKKLEGSLRYLDKMRAASTAMMTYWTLAGDQRLATAPRDTLKKIHEVVQDGTDFVLEGVKELEQQKRMQQRRYNGSAGSGNAAAPTKKVSLQDAWSKTIELPSAAAPMTVDDEENNKNANDSNKKPRLNSYRPYYKTRMLFRPNRKLPPPLLMAIRRKGADLRQASSGDTNAAHLVLDFDDAFAMTIYFSPLIVTLRAKPKGGDGDVTTSITGSSSATWKPLSHGLTPWGSTLDSSDFLRNKPDDNNNQQQQQQLSVWGVTSDYESIGRVVEERLRDASTHATAMLRKCFKNHVKDKTVDFEVELLEGSALLEFLQLARSTYMPHWEDADV